MADIKIKTPAEYIADNSTGLMNELQRYDIQINKLGVIGYFLNILGNTQYDSTTYYNNLFKEGFVASALDDSNLYMHSSIYGYVPSYGIPSTASGKFIFDFSFLPSKQDTIYKREVIYKNIMFTINGHTFTTDAEYRFIEDNSNYYCMIYTPDGKVQYVSSSSSAIEAPFINVMQYSKRITTILIQNYDFSTYYPYQFNITNGFLHKLEVSVETSSSTWENFTVKQMKYLEDSTSSVVFLKSLSSTSFLLEFGSGVRGRYVSGDSAKLSIYETDGSSGNINITDNIKLTNSVQNPAELTSYQNVEGVQIDTGKVICIAKQTNIVGDEQSFISSDVRDILSVTFEYSEGGRDQYTGYELRQNIVKYIQSRDNLISQVDYYNVASKYINDFKFLFKKTSFMDNIFYLYKIFRNKYQLPSYALTKSQMLIDDYTTKTTLYGMGSTVKGSLSAGTYKYYIRATDGFKETARSDEITVSVDGTLSTSIVLQWNPVDRCEKYIIYGRPNSDGVYKYWEVYGTEFVDTGLDNSNTSYPLETNAPIVYYPTFKVQDEIFISPFIYKYDPYFNWYKGYILYNSMIVNLTSLEQSTVQYSYDVPVFYFNIQYDYNKRKTYIYVKSHQSIKDYKLYLSIFGLNIINEDLPNVDDNTFVYEYSNSTYGILDSSIILELQVSRIESDGSLVHLVTGKTSNVDQTVDITDQLKLFKYNGTMNHNYIINIPMIQKSVYDADPGYYIDKMYEFLFTNQLSENRMVSDEIQFRFLNSYLIDKFYLAQLVTQKYSTFDLKLPLKLSVTCYIDSQYLKENDVDLTTEKDNLYLLLAQKLQDDYSGVSIKYYNSQIVDFVHTSRPFIKSVIVQLTDSDGNIIDSGLEMLSDKEIMNNIHDNSDQENKKINIIGYCPPIWWWDVDNINLKFLF